MFRNQIEYSILLIFLVCPLFAFAKASNNSEQSSRKPKTNYSTYQNELLVIGALKNLYSAQSVYFSTVGERRFGNLSQLRKADLIDDYLAAGEKFGYLFSVQISPFEFDPRFIVLAKPKIYRKTGKRSFYFDASCEVRGADKNGADADIDDAIIETCIPTIAFDNERTAIQTVRWLASAQETYKATAGNGNYGSFEDLYEIGLITAELATGYYHNYVYQMFWIDQVPEIPLPARFKIFAAPNAYRQMGFRSFFTDQTGVVRGADHQGQNGDENDPPIENVFIDYKSGRDTMYFGLPSVNNMRRGKSER